MNEVDAEVKPGILINDLSEESHKEFKLILENSYARRLKNYPKTMGYTLSRAVNYVHM